jgi:hypothetical protein
VQPPEPPVPCTEGKEPSRLYFEHVSEELRKTTDVRITCTTSDSLITEKRIVGGGALFSSGNEEMIRKRIQLADRYHPIRVANDSANLRVQYLAADPEANAEAYKEVKKVKKAVDGRSVHIEPEVHVEAKDLLSVADQKAHIISYVGHADTSGGYSKGSLRLEDKKLGPGAFARMLNKLCNPDAQGNRIHGLVLNACQTITLYEHKEFTSKPGFVISTNRKITTAAGVAFSVKFYKCIANGDSLLTSYYHAVLQISNEFPEDLGIHELHINESRLAEIVEDMDVATNKIEAKKRERDAEAVQNITNVTVCVFLIIFE